MCICIIQANHICLSSMCVYTYIYIYIYTYNVYIYIYIYITQAVDLLCASGLLGVALDGEDVDDQGPRIQNT